MEQPCRRFVRLCWLANDRLSAPSTVATKGLTTMPAPDGTRTIADELNDIAQECGDLAVRYLDETIARCPTFEEYVALNDAVLNPLERLLAWCRATMRAACVLSDAGYREASEVLLQTQVPVLREQRAAIALPGVQ
jgi:hypothetical protein